MLVRQPVELTNAKLEEAQRLARRAVNVAVACVEEADGYCIEQLATATVTAICRGDARRGMKLGRLLDAAHVSRGHARDRHFSPALIELADIAVRATAVLAKRAVHYEHLYVRWASTGRERNCLATHRVRNVTPGLRYAGIAASCDDRHLPTLEIPFTTGTRHDHSSPRADAGEIARLTKELGRRPSGTVAEHFQELLDAQRAARSRVERTDARTHPASTLAKFGFSDLVIVTRMPCGPARVRNAEGEEIREPGRDPALMRVLTRAGKRGIAQMGSRHPSSEDFSLAELAVEGFEQRTFEHSDVDRELANDVEWGVTWHWRREGQCLLRVQVDEESVRMDEWRVLGLEDRLDLAVGLVRRHEQRWTNNCVTRCLLDTGPGLIEVITHRSDAAMRALLRIGNAATVDADRLARARHAAG